jgi:hypothetical protein
METMASGVASHCEMMQSSSSNSDSKSEHHDNPNCNACSLCMSLAFGVPTQLMSDIKLSYQLSQRVSLLIDSALLALPINPSCNSPSSRPSKIWMEFE